MKRRRTGFPLASAITVALAAAPLASHAQDAQSGHGQPEPPMKGIHWAKGHVPAARPGSGSPNMTWHGGPILTNVSVLPIYWGTGWGSPTFTGDKRAGLHSFYGGMGGSGYGATADEYTAGSTQVGNIVSVSTSDLIDVSATPNNVGKTTGPILTEVCNALSTAGVTPVTNGYYPVYTDQPRGHANFCAWHSAGTCSGVAVQFAFFFNLDGDPGCDPEDSSGLHSQGLAALANVSGHEISEARTDPQLNAWYDGSGAENADKCAWVFGTPLLKFKNNTYWKIQGNWSNHAYNTGTGYANNSGQTGCVDGGNYM